MKLYNSLTQRVEPFNPRGNTVTMYVCGITPYDTTHLGHAFTYCSMDILLRYLEQRGLTVKYAQNVTDIDDDILRKAKEVGENWRSLGDRWTSLFIRDMQRLNVCPPDYFPRATEVIPEIIAAVQKLLKESLAYEVDGNVYYDIERWPEFGKLSQLPRVEMLPIANERGNKASDPNKRHPLDFVLWQSEPVPADVAAAGEAAPAWPSPWGTGRPGWHIECSTLASRFLGETIDIHGGGADLCFPHHECEIAQIEPVTNQPFVRLWVHTAMVRYQGEKMSKSLGNLVMVSQLLETYPADALRIYLAQHHYRDSWSYDEDDLQKAAMLAGQMQAAARVAGGDGLALPDDNIWAAFITHMDDDLDTPGVVQVLETFADEILDAARGGRDVSEAQKTLCTLASVFGLRLDQYGQDSKVLEGWNKHLKKFAEKA